MNEKLKQINLHRMTCQMAGIQIDNYSVDLITQLGELSKKKGEEISVKDVVKLQTELMEKWNINPQK
jgi:hypothetical protein